MRYQDFVLQLSSASNGRIRAGVRASPLGEDEDVFSTTWGRRFCADPGSLSSVLLRDIAAPAKKGSRRITPEELGNELYQLLLPGRVRSLFERSLERARAEDMGLRLKIVINPHDAPARLLQDLPWELLRSERKAEFLALSEETPVVRSLVVPQPSRNPELPGRVRVLAVRSTPRGTAPLDLQRELAGMMAVEVVPCAARLGEVRRMLAECGTFDVLHFLGHGEFLGGGEGTLVFESAQGEAERVRGASLSQTLRDYPSVRLVVLNACKTGRAEADGRPFGSVAAALVQAGFPSTLAMREAISDAAAIEFSHTFYREIAHRKPVESALAKARKTVFDLAPDSPEWAVPVLFLRASPWREDGTAGMVQTAIELFRSGSYALARRKCQEALMVDPESYRARLFEIVSRMVLYTPLTLDGIGKIDADLQDLLRAPDLEVVGVAQLVLGILRFDVTRPRGARVRGVASERIFEALKLSRRSALELEIAHVLRASRDARILFNLNS